MGEAFLILFVPLAGLVLGSLVTTMALRTARGEQGLVGRSHCDGCGVALGLVSTVPLMSYLCLRGACGRCGAPIDRVHLAGELLGLMIAVASFAAVSGPRGLVVAVLGFALLAASVHDAKTRRLPDLLTLVVAVCGAALAAMSSMTALWMAAVTGGVALIVMEALRRGFILLRRKAGLGSGDVKLIAALAVWMGPATPWMVAGAAGLGLLLAVATRRREGRIAFGPMIALSAYGLGLLRETATWPVQ